MLIYVAQSIERKFQNIRGPIFGSLDRFQYTMSLTKCETLPNALLKLNLEP